jgi:hypothetical protein
MCSGFGFVPRLRLVASSEGEKAGYACVLPA